MVSPLAALSTLYATEALVLERSLKANCPVDSGDLKRSIRVFSTLGGLDVRMLFYGYIQNYTQNAGWIFRSLVVSVPIRWFDKDNVEYFLVDLAGVPSAEGAVPAILGLAAVGLGVLPEILELVTDPTEPVEAATP